LLALEDKAQRYLEESIGHLRKVVTDLRDQRADEDLDLELWRAYSKAEFALFVLSISDEEKRWAVEEEIGRGIPSVLLLEEAEQLLRDASRSSAPSSEDSLARIWKAETRIIHVSKMLQKEGQTRKS